MSAPVMVGMRLPDIDVWSERVVVALGQNPGVFTGPGTNTYLIGTGSRRILLDTGEGRPEYLDVLERACARAGVTGLQEIVLTHGHPDHMGGVPGVLERFGPLKVSKLGWPGNDEAYGVELTPIGDGSRLSTPGATLRAVHAPGHAQDHLCFVLEEEGALFSGDNVLGVGTTVIPARGGDLLDYLASLERLLAESPGAIYPAHGPRIADGKAKILEYIAHRREREAQILAVLAQGITQIPEMVRRIYAGYPETLFPAASMSVASHLRKLEREGRVARDGEDLFAARWSPA
jgi:ribonuclease/clavin/mitogillin